MLIIVSKIDIAASRGLHINAEDLSQKLGCSVLLTNFNKKSFRNDLVPFIANGFSNDEVQPFVLRYPEPIESAIDNFPMDAKESANTPCQSLIYIRCGAVLPKNKQV